MTRVRRRRLRALAGVLLAAFVGLVSLEHVLEPSLSPWRHQISEYANRGSGWLMTLGFVGWAASLALTALLLRRRRELAGSLVLAALGLTLIAVVPTQTTAGALPTGVRPTSAGRLHDLGGEMATAGLLLGGLVLACSPWAPIILRRLSAAVVLWALLVSVLGLAAAPDAGGLRQRLVVVAGAAWQAALLAGADPSWRGAERGDGARSAKPSKWRPWRY